MNRVGIFMADEGEGWLGGSNYMGNLIRAIYDNPQRGIDIVIFCPPGQTSAIRDKVGSCDVVEAGFLDSKLSVRAARSISRATIGSDILAERALLARGITCLSHSGCCGSKFRIPVINWIPDFQHLRLPEMFSVFEREQRNSSFSTLVRCSDTIIVSSFDVKADLGQFAPHNQDNYIVLPFAINLSDAEISEVTSLELTEKYRLPDRYFFLPNQFWKHKNHVVVIEALRKLKLNGLEVHVVCCGREHDHRHPYAFDELMTRASSYGLESVFRTLGVLPRRDLLGLMRDCVAVINPSLFEGWSTSVEEARAVGKKLLVSDIAVHREQAAPGAYYFGPNDASALADGLLALIAGYSKTADADRMAGAGPARRLRARSFAESYEHAVHKTVITAHRHR